MNTRLSYPLRATAQVWHSSCCLSWHSGGGTGTQYEGQKHDLGWRAVEKVGHWPLVRTSLRVIRTWANFHSQACLTHRASGRCSWHTLHLAVRLDRAAAETISNNLCLSVCRAGSWCWTLPKKKRALLSPFSNPWKCKVFNIISFDDSSTFL